MDGALVPFTDRLVAVASGLTSTSSSSEWLVLTAILLDQKDDRPALEVVFAAFEVDTPRVDMNISLHD